MERVKGIVGGTITRRVIAIGLCAIAIAFCVIAQAPDDAAAPGDSINSEIAADAAAIALQFRLLKEGAPIVNTPMLGVFSKASGLVDVAHLERGLRWKLSGTAAATNIAALRAGYEAASIKP